MTLLAQLCTVPIQMSIPVSHHPLLLIKRNNLHLCLPQITILARIKLMEIASRRQLPNRARYRTDTELMATQTNSLWTDKALQTFQVSFHFIYNQFTNRTKIHKHKLSNTESTSGYVNSSSTQSNASSSSSSVSSNTPNTVSQVTAPQTIQYSNSNGCTNVGANNTAVNYVNHVASLNSSTLTGPPPQQHGINENYAPQYPSQYYYPVNQPKLQPHLKNEELNSISTVC